MTAPYFRGETGDAGLYRIATSLDSEAADDNKDKERGRGRERAGEGRKEGGVELGRKIRRGGGEQVIDDGDDGTGAETEE